MMITQTQLALKFANVRRDHKLTFRDVEKATGISPSTLQRFEVQRGQLDTDHFIIIAQWLRVPLDEPKNDPPKTFDGIEKSLQADKFLTPEGRIALLRLMSEAYYHLTGKVLCMVHQTIVN
jgi:transcriptional regulator with XRE-family HTH domain